MQAESCIRRQPPKRTAAGVQRADEDVIAHEQKQADEVEPTNLVSDEDDDVDMKDELDLRHEGMSKCEHVRGPHISEPQRRQLGDDLVDETVQRSCRPAQNAGFVGQAIIDHCSHHLSGLAVDRKHVP